jgi:hypothetical protein
MPRLPPAGSTLLAFLEILQNAQGVMGRLRLMPPRHDQQVRNQGIHATTTMQASIDSHNLHPASPLFNPRFTTSKSHSNDCRNTAYSLLK